MSQHPPGGPSQAQGSVTVVEEEVNKEEEVRGAEGGENTTAASLKLTKKEEPKKSVKWTSDTVDNEGLGRKNSTCCCVYVTPKRCGAGSYSSEDDDDDDCPHCPGHHGKDVKGGDRPGAEGDGEGAAAATS